MTDAEPVEQEPDDTPRADAEESNASRGDEKKSRGVGRAIANTVNGILEALRP